MGVVAVADISWGVVPLVSMELLADGEKDEPEVRAPRTEPLGLVDVWIKVVGIVQGQSVIVTVSPAVAV